MADITNPFDLLGETDENSEPNIEQLAAAKAKAAAPKKEEPKAAAKAPAAKSDAGRGARGGRGGDVRGRGAPGRGRLGAPRPESAEVAENGYEAGAPAARGRGGRGEGRGRGDRGGRGEGRGRGAGRGSYDSSRPRREFDRHDGTGRGYEASKRGGGGRGNWGNDDGSADAPAAEETPAVAEEVAEKPEGEAAEEPAAEEVAPVEEVKEMSLDEYEVLLAEKKAALNKKAATRAVDISEFANLKAVNKDEEEEENPLEVSNAKEKKGPRAKELKAKEVLQANFKVASDSAGFSERRGRGDRGDRGGRGRGFGGRGDRFERSERPAFAGRGAGRGPSGPGAAINVEDTSAFPSLG